MFTLRPERVPRHKSMVDTRVSNGCVAIGLDSWHSIQSMFHKIQNAFYA